MQSCNKKMITRRQLMLAGSHLSLLCLPLLMTTQQAMAHREKTLFTTIQYNVRSGMLEVVHRCYAHDVEHTLGNKLRADGGLDSVEARARVSLELSNAFTLWNDADGERIPLELIGAELDGEFLYIYQEAELPQMPASFRIRHLMLRNHWPDMTNFVNVMFDSGVASLVFNESVDVMSVKAGK